MFAIGNDLYWGKEDHDSPKPIILLLGDDAFIATKNWERESYTMKRFDPASPVKYLRKLSYDEFEVLTGFHFFDFHSLELDSLPCVARHLGKLVHGEDTEFGDHRLYWKW